MGLINIPDRPRIFKPIGMPQIDWDDPLNRGLVGHWGMFPYEAGGKVIHDLSGNGNTGTFSVPSPSWVPGQFGSSLFFDGNNKHIIIPDHPSLHVDHFTVVSWVKHFGNHGDTDGAIWWDRYDAFGQNAILISNEDAVKLKFNIAGTDRAVTVGTGLVTQNVWHQIVVTHDGVNQKVYLDGNYIGGMSFSGVLGQSSNVREIGVGYGATQRDLNGIIDHILIYNRAKTASEIAELYRRPF